MGCWVEEQKIQKLFSGFYLPHLLHPLPCPWPGSTLPITKEQGLPKPEQGHWVHRLWDLAESQPLYLSPATMQ